MPGSDDGPDEEGRKRKLDEIDDELKTPKGGSGIGRLQSGGGNAMRDKVHKLLTDALSSGEDANRQLIRSIAEEVEASLYDSCKGVNEQYKKKAQTLKFNLSTNEELRDKVIDRSIVPGNLVNMSTADLARKDLKKRRVTAAEESLKEVVNNEEVQKLKQAAAGLTMRKTDQGLVARGHTMIEAKLREQMQEKEKEEEAKRKEEEEKEKQRKKREEDEKEKKRKEAETLVTAGLDMGQDDEKSYLSTFTWKQVEGEEGEEGVSMEEDESRLVSSPTLEDSQDVGGHLYEPQITLPTLDDQGELDGPRMGGLEGGGGHLVWHGTLCPASGRKDAFDLDASLVDGQGVHDLMPSDLSVKGTLPLQAVKDYLESKMRDKSKERSVYKLTPHHDQQHDSKAHELYRQFTESLRKHHRAGVLIDSKQMLLYAVPPGNSLASSLVAEDDARGHLIAVALTSRRKEAKRSVEEIAADVSADFRTALGAEETMVKLMASVIGKVKTPDCNMRASLVAGSNRLDKVPREIGVRGRAELEQVIEYLLQQQVMVVEFEPEGEEDSATYLQISELLMEKRRAAVVLDTASALMYLIPPADEAGKLLDPPADSCSNMLGVLLINQHGGEDGKDHQPTDNQQAESATRKRGDTPPTPPDRVQVSKQALDSGMTDGAPLPGGNGAAAAAVPMAGASAGNGSSDNSQAARENRPSPVLLPQSSRATGAALPADVDPSPRPYYTPTAAAMDSWKQQPEVAVQAHQPQWNQQGAMAAHSPRGYSQHPAGHPAQPDGPHPHSYQHKPFNAARPPPPQHPPPANHMAMNHPPQQFAPHLSHGPPAGAMPGNGYPVGGGMGMAGPGLHGMPGGPGTMYGHPQGPGMGRAHVPNGNAFHRGPPPGYHRPY